MSDINSNDDTTTTGTLPPAGWYPDPANASVQRYWSGTAWTEVTGAPDAVTTPATSRDTAARVSATGTPRRGLRWWHWVLIAVGAIVLAGIIGGVLGGGSENDADAADGAQPADVQETSEPLADEVDTTVDVPDVIGLTVTQARVALESAGFVFRIDDGAGEDWIVVTQGPDGGAAELGTNVSVLAEAPQPEYTLAQENALRAAESYLEFSSFSRQGLIDQLSSEYGSGFTVEDSTWAADAVGADWNAEAVEAATSYLEFSSFSRQGLYDQLTSPYGSHFTPEQASHALAAVGY
ncbi:Ltp family lipoprotein [Microbacterium koreense]|uniref:Ltp family lipoprotein n=1 Tax=Microbacterium koreense TaxID=323761 RepID=A0ABW2ZS46_9MICO